MCTIRAHYGDSFSTWMNDTVLKNQRVKIRYRHVMGFV